MVNLADTDLETGSIPVVSIASPLVSHGVHKSKVFGSILWEIELKNVFQKIAITNSLSSNKIPFIDVTHSISDIDVSLFHHHDHGETRKSDAEKA
jgi:hypothetical protein